MRQQLSSVRGLIAAITIASATLAQSVGPDVTVSSLTDVGAYGQSLGITAFAVGTVACNVGNQPVQWTQNNNQHPVIAQNMYRYLNGELQQIGQSWLKHGFASTNSPGCGSCIQPPGGGSQLGVGCTDAYGSGLNGSQTYLGPRYQVNAATGAYPWPHASPTGDATIRGRLQVKNGDLDPAANAGARYFVEAHYVTADDAIAGNKNNNASWQEIYAPAVGANGNVSFFGSVHTQQPAIYAWQFVDPGVSLATVDVPGDGRLVVACKGLNLGYGVVRYVYAVYNMNSDRSVQAVTIGLPAGAAVQNLAFHDVDYHSGEPYVGTDWTPTVGATSVAWACDPYGTNVNANALRWGTMYTFSFESDMPPTPTVTLGLFKPGSPASVSASISPTVGCLPQPVAPPVAFTYTANTSAPYDFIDISATGTNGPTGDDSAVTANLGFTFTFYGVATTQIQISTNGFLSLPGHNATAFNNTSIPNATEPNATICGYWDDLHAAPTGGGTIKYQTVGSAPNRRFVVHYVGIWHYGLTASSAETFEIILNENGNEIVSTCVTTPSAANLGGGVSATRGVESPTGSSGTLVTGTVLNGTTVKYTPAGLTIPPSAYLTLTGTGAASTTLSLRILSAPSKPLILAVDTSAGPTSLGPLGSLSLGLSPGFLALADGIGVFQPPNPADVTDACGNYLWSYTFGGTGLPSGLVLYFQGVVVDPAAPNGSFHLTTPRTLTVP
jgi:hypothetical protein